MQRHRVVVDRGAPGRRLAPRFQPARKHCRVVVDARVVERALRRGDSGEGEGSDRNTLRPHRPEKIVEMAVVVEHQLRLEARLLEVGKQQALWLRGRIQCLVRRLAARGAQEADRRRAAVGRDRVEAA